MTTQRFDTVLDSADDTVFALRHSGARRFAADCLAAGQAFIEESQYWDQPQLAMWLLGPYSQNAQDVVSLPPSSRPQLREICATSTMVIDDARDEVSDKLDRLYDASTSSDVVFSMIEAGYVAQIVDANGATGWAPTTTASRLADRVLSLFVAAFLSTVFEGQSESQMPLAA